MQDPRETLALVAHSDGDRLLAGNETSPLRKDTDGDGLSDYGESLTHTDGLNPESFLAIGQIAQLAGDTVIHRVATRNVHYVIQYSPDLSQSSTAPSGQDDDEQADILAVRAKPRTYPRK